LIELNERLSTGKTVYGTCALWLRRRLYSLTGRIDRATVQPLSNRPSLNSGWRVLSEGSSRSVTDLGLASKPLSRAAEQLRDGPTSLHKGRTG
jgi:hypothetical protein